MNDNWSRYYAGEVTVDLYIRNLYGHKDLICAIVESGAKCILEVGAGTGTLSIFLSTMGLTVTTLDNSEEILRKAKTVTEKFGGKNVLVEGDAFKLPFANNSFDLVFHQGLLEHFSDQEIHQLLDEQLRVAPVVLFGVPNQNYMRKDFGNERLLSKTAWEKILQPYRILISQNYALKIFPKWYLPRVPIQYMAKIIKL
jgi:ubiquinone/menaquinone biosynthesis C-methylase UbiE